MKRIAIASILAVAVVVVVASAAGCLRLDAKVLSNAPPEAAVAADALRQTVTIGASVTLDGVGTDPDCADPKNAACVPLSFAWSQINIVTPAALQNASTAHAVFQTSELGQFFFQLTVSDGLATSAPVVVEVDVTADPQNTAPVAVATVESENVPNLTSVILDGSASSDAEDGDHLAYLWTIVSPEDGSGVTFSPATRDVAKPSVLLSRKGHYVFQLVVTDTQGLASLPVTVTLTSSNSPPELSTEALRTTHNREEIVLTATAVDADNDPALTFRWSLVDFPAGGEVPLVVGTDGTARFTPSRKTTEDNPALCAVGTHACYVLEVEASDGSASSIPQQVFVASLNNQPIAVGNDGESQSVSVKLDAAGSSDLDNDLLTFQWTELTGPTLGGGTVVSGRRVFTGATVNTVPADALSSADFTFELVANDGTSDSVPVTIGVHYEGLGHRPTLSLSTGVVRVLEGDPLFVSDIATATDPDDGDIVTITWLRDDTVSSPLFPATLFGPRPDVIAPAFPSLVASGSTTAVYRIHASDGNPDHDTAEQLVTIAVAPSPTSQPGIWVSTGSLAADSDTCGASLTPCATLPHALARIAAEVALGTDASTLGLQLTAGRFPATGTIAWPAGISIAGGFDENTFAPGAGTSTIEVNAPTAAAIGLVLGSTVQGVTFSDVEVTVLDSPAATGVTAIQCLGCGVSLRNVAVNVTATTNLANVTIVALEVSGAGGVADVGDVASATRGLTASLVPIGGNGQQGNQSTIAFQVHDGGTAHIANSDVTMQVNTFFGSAIGVNLVNAQADVTASRIITVGTGLGQAGAFLNPGTLTMTNSIVLNRGGRGQAVSVSAGSQATLLYNTFEGPSAGDNGVIGIVANGPTLLMSSIIHGYNHNMQTSRNIADVLVGNVFDPSLAALECEVIVPNGAALNVPFGTDCNLRSGVAWTNNLSATCPVVDRSGGDMHLNRAVANPCVGAGVGSSPVGVSPALDFDGEPRGATLDIGADDDVN